MITIPTIRPLDLIIYLFISFTYLLIYLLTKIVMTFGMPHGRAYLQQQQQQSKHKPSGSCYSEIHGIIRQQIVFLINYLFIYVLLNKYTNWFSLIYWRINITFHFHFSLHCTPLLYTHACPFQTLSHLILGFSQCKHVLPHKRFFLIVRV